MSSFRPILPAPQTGGDSNTHDSGNSGSIDSTGRSLGRRDAVSQACYACRKAKAKCDGGRPTCRTCLSKKRQCVYEFEDGRSTVAALRSRVHELEQQVDQFKSAGQLDAAHSQSQFQSMSETPPTTHRSQPPGIVSQRFLPSISVTQQAVDGFFSSSGKLFHVFTRQQVSQFIDSVWKGADIESQTWRADVCCLMAVAAAGIQYADTTEGADASNTFYDISKVLLDDVLETRPLDAIKVCTLLCMYNVMTKAVVSIAFADIGLGLCRRFGLYSRLRQLPALTDSKWIDYRKTWRTLMFLSTWVSATLGYRSGNYDLFDQISPSDLQIADVSDISEVVQTEMVGIAVIKVKILYMHRFHKDLDWAITSVARDLEEWYDGLPQVMRLQELSAQDLPPDVRRSIYLVHLLYLGANMLLFRRIALEAVRSSNNHGVLPTPWQPSREQYSKQADGALLAASGSSKIIKIMMGENCVFKRCWVVIFQSYTACLITLHAVLRKIAMKTQPSSYEENLQDIRSCLDALSFCGSLDPVAARFHKALLFIYNSLISNDMNKPTTSAGPDMDVEPQQPPTIEQNAIVSGTLDTSLLSTPSVDLPRNADPSLEELSTNLLVMLCRPFGDPINRKEPKECLDIGYKTARTQKELQCLMRKLDWDFDDTIPFQWDTEKLGPSNDRIAQLSRDLASSGHFGNLGADSTAPTQNRFMSSSGPNSRTPADYFQTRP